VIVAYGAPLQQSNKQYLPSSVMW